jgi:hypothetical protein
MFFFPCRMDRTSTHESHRAHFRAHLQQATAEARDGSCTGAARALTDMFMGGCGANSAPDASFSRAKGFETEPGFAKGAAKRVPTSAHTACNTIATRPPTDGLAKHPREEKRGPSLCS